MGAAALQCSAVCRIVGKLGRQLKNFACSPNSVVCRVNAHSITCQQRYEQIYKQSFSTPTPAPHQYLHRAIPIIPSQISNLQSGSEKVSVLVWCVAHIVLVSW